MKQTAQSDRPHGARQHGGVGDQRRCGGPSSSITTDSAGEGLQRPRRRFVPVGGNPATTLGAGPRLNAFQYAAESGRRVSREQCGHHRECVDGSAGVAMRTSPRCWGSAGCGVRAARFSGGPARGKPGTVWALRQRAHRRRQRSGFPGQSRPSSTAASNGSAGCLFRLQAGITASTVFLPVGNWIDFVQPFVEHEVLPRPRLPVVHQRVDGAPSSNFFDDVYEANTERATAR